MIHANSLQLTKLGMLLQEVAAQIRARPKPNVAGKVALNETRKNSAFVLVAINGAKALSFFLVLRQGFFNDFDRRIRWADVIHLDLFAFQ